jgi:predicted ATPase
MTSCAKFATQPLDVLPDDSPFRQLDPPQRRQRTLTALTRVVLRASQMQPLLLVCEALHWMDTETQALLDSLIESLPTARLLLLVTYRPEYQHGWCSQTSYRQLRLDPLPPAGLDQGIGHFMLFEVDSEARAPAPPIPILLRTSSAASDRKSAPLPSCRQAG